MSAGREAHARSPKSSALIAPIITTTASVAALVIALTLEIALVLYLVIGLLLPRIALSPARARRRRWSPTV
jgi:Flp pilus assembly protein TadB